VAAVAVLVQVLVSTLQVVARVGFAQLLLQLVAVAL
jgi:hypothetical protein